MAKRKAKKVKDSNSSDKSLEGWIWDAACSIRGAQEAAKYKDFILPLIFTKRLCDVFDDELNKIADRVGSRAKAFKLVEIDKKLVRFYLPLQPEDTEDEVWSVIRELTDSIGEKLTDYLRAIAKANPLLKGIIDRIDFNATTHGQRDLDDDRLSNLIEKISEKRLGLHDVEPDIIGRSYEYLIRKFAEGSGQSAGEFYTPKEVGIIMAKIMNPQPGMTVYDPCCGSAGLLIKCQLVMKTAPSYPPSVGEEEKENPPELGGRGAKASELKSAVSNHPNLGEDIKGAKAAPLQLFGQEYTPNTWAMANMNTIIHDLDGKIEIGDSFRHPKFKEGNKLKQFDRVVANPMWNQNWFTEADYDGDELGRFPKGAGFPGSKADWGWVQHIWASVNDTGKAAIVLDTGAASRGSGNANKDKEKEVRKWFIEQDLIEGVIYLPENLFYNTNAPGIILFLNRAKPTERKDKLFLINASLVYAKGDPKNYIPDEGIEKIASSFLEWRESEKFSQIIDKAEIVRNDYNISPSRYIHVAEAEEFRPISEILADLEALETEAEETNRVLKSILEQFR